MRQRTAVDGAIDAAAGSATAAPARSLNADRPAFGDAGALGGLGSIAVPGAARGGGAGKR
jgi:hypothetical protein